MEQTQVFYDNQEVQAGDLNNVSQFASDSLDHAVNDGIASGHYYTGLASAQTATSQVTTAPGRLYWGGAVYAALSPTVFALFPYLPSTTSKIVAITANTNTLATDVETRDYITDVDTGATQPQSVAQQNLRQCVLSLIAGVESPQPQPPTRSERRR